MKIHDITQELFSCKVYPGDRAPELIAEKRISDGELYNLTSLSMCTHNGTHIDAPFHFLADGETVEAIPLERTVGRCFVAEFDGELGAREAEKILAKAREVEPESAKKILLKGDALVTLESAKIFAEAKLELLGVESQSVGPEDAPMATHLALLRAGCVLLEGLRLGAVAQGAYLLSAAPLKLAGSDGAPCRAILIEL